MHVHVHVVTTLLGGKKTSQLVRYPDLHVVTCTQKYNLRSGRPIKVSLKMSSGNFSGCCGGQYGLDHSQLHGPHPF